MHTLVCSTYLYQQLYFCLSVGLFSCLSVCLSVSLIVQLFVCSTVFQTILPAAILVVVLYYCCCCFLYPLSKTTLCISSLSCLSSLHLSIQLSRWRCLLFWLNAFLVFVVIFVVIFYICILFVSKLCCLYVLGHCKNIFTKIYLTYVILFTTFSTFFVTFTLFRDLSTFSPLLTLFGLFHHISTFFRFFTIIRIFHHINIYQYFTHFSDFFMISQLFHHINQYLSKCFRFFTKILILSDFFKTFWLFRCISIFFHYFPTF